jgi:oligopeptidase B
MMSTLAAGSHSPVAERRPFAVQRHGELFEDPYAWLRQRDDPAVRAYLEAENAYADTVLVETKGLQEALYHEMLGRIKQTDLTVPYRDRGYFYYSRTEEGKQYPILCRKSGSLDAEEQVLLDLNALAVGKSYMSLGEYAVNDDGGLLAYSTDETGFRDYTLQVKDLRTGQDLPLRIPKAGSAAWAADGMTLFYAIEDEAKRPWRVYRHRLGTEDHVVVYEEADEAFRVGLGRSRSGQYLFLVSGSHTTSETRYLAAATPGDAWILFAPRVQDREYDLDHQDDRWIVRINDTGRNFRLVAARLETPDQGNWLELVPHRGDVMIEAADAFADHVVLTEREDGLPRLRILDRSGGSHHIPFPEAICEAFLGPNREYRSPRVRFHYQSLVTPNSVFDYDVTSGASTLLKQTEVLGGYDPALYASERVRAAAPDGTLVPVSVVYRRDRPRDGTQPLHLTGYGAYGISYPIAFSSNRLSLLDRGFACAIAHIRGGGDLGKPWHDAGRMAAKQNTFTDFIAAADHLVATGWTSRDRLAIEGGSAGGLLMGAVINRRPDLCRAALLQVPFLDVVNTMSDESLPLTVGEYEEWGNPGDPEQFRWLRAYDPYMNLRPGSYPTMLVRTSFNDSQVMYWEPAKYVARLRTLKTDSNPLLLVTNMGAGHGGASGRYDRLREIALDYAFILLTVGTPS